MKKIIFSILTLVISFSGCVSSSNSGNVTQSAGASSGMTLDQAIAEAAKRIEERITAGSKIAPLNFNSSSDRFSVYVLDELTANLVENGKIIVVDRSEIDLIRSEFNFQYSGEVEDESMQTLGRMLGAQSIISGSLTDMGGFYRIMIRVLNVQNASVEVQYRTNIDSDHVIAALLTGGMTAATVSVSSTDQTTQSQTQQTVQIPSQQTPQTLSQSNVIIVEGASLTEKLQWLETNALNNTEYRLVLTGNESLSTPILLQTRRRNVTIRLISSGDESILSLTGNGSIFTIESDITLILDNGIILIGRNNNDASLININNRGTLIMNPGSKISSNIVTREFHGGGGIRVMSNGNFTMNGGEITGNITKGQGGAIFVNTNGNFLMNGGSIFNNKIDGHYTGGGGGVYILGVFTMVGGEISDNKAAAFHSTGGGDGGGVNVGKGGSFIMRGGEIYGNIANSMGGGVHIAHDGTFSMTGGEIGGNSAINFFGGGVCAYGTFNKTGGIIYGSTGTNNDNRASRGEGNAVVTPGIGSGYKFRNSTAGPTVRMDSKTRGSAGGWEN